MVSGDTSFTATNSKLVEVCLRMPVVVSRKKFSVIALRPIFTNKIASSKPANGAILEHESGINSGTDNFSSKAVIQRQS